MKAILQLGTFSTMIDVPETRRKIYVLDPTTPMITDFYKLPPTPSIEHPIMKLVFEFKTYLDKDIALYIYTGKE